VKRRPQRRLERSRANSNVRERCAPSGATNWLREVFQPSPTLCAHRTFVRQMQTAPLAHSQTEADARTRTPARKAPPVVSSETCGTSYVTCSTRTNGSPPRSTAKEAGSAAAATSSCRNASGLNGSTTPTANRRGEPRGCTESDASVLITPYERRRPNSARRRRGSRSLSSGGADARTRTGDPFITSEGVGSFAVASGCHTPQGYAERLRSERNPDRRRATTSCARVVRVAVSLSYASGPVRCRSVDAS